MTAIVYISVAQIFAQRWFVYNSLSPILSYDIRRGRKSGDLGDQTEFIVVSMPINQSRYTWKMTPQFIGYLMSQAC